MDKPRKCKTCGRKFKPSSRHLDCPSCRSLKKRHPCAQCGKLVTEAATLCLKCLGKNNSGENNHSWKGGIKSSQGYSLRMCKDHPRAKSNNGYVFEHILVMENYLGRYLLPGENVHHKNGIRDDNRLDNLELWTKPQMSGIRVEDAIKWAHEVLEKYKNYNLGC